ncbi:MAG: hypothetical protein WA838_12905, partial [Xanthobacteraceae bacterium]
MSQFPLYLPKADIAEHLRHVRFSNRPVRVKRFQTIRRCSVNVTHGLVLLFGIGTKALVWGFFSQEVYAERHIFFHSSVSLFDLRVRSFVPMARPRLD